MLRPLLPLLFLLITGWISIANAELRCEGLMSPVPDTAREACLIECAAYYQENPGARPESTQETCRDFFEGVGRRLTGQSAENLALACGKGVWDGVLSFPERVKAYQIMMEDFGKFLQSRNEELQQCDRDPACRRVLGRDLDAYRDRKADGTYAVDDSVLDARVQNMGIIQLTQMSQQARWDNQRRCLNKFGDLTTELVPPSGEWKYEQEIQRYDRIIAWDPDCANLMPLPKPTRDFDKPVPRKSFLETLGIKPQCYTPGKATELVCLEIAKMVTDPLMVVGGGGVLATKMLVTAGIKVGASVAPKIVTLLARPTTTVVAADAATAGVMDGAMATALEISAGKPLTVVANQASDLASAGSAVAKESVPSVPTTVATGAFNTKDELIAGFATKKLSTPAEQKYFYDLATSATPRNDVTFFRFENASQKKLNTLFNNNKLVDAINNRQFSQIKEGIEALKKEYPNLKITSSGADWKALDVVVEGNPPPGFYAKLDDVYKKASAQTEADLKRLGIMPENESVKQWYFAGYEEKRADMADLATRVNRTLSGPSQMRSASDPAIQANAKSYIEQAEVFRAKMQDTMAPKGLMQEVPGTGKMIPTKEVFELVRKESNPDKLREAINATLETNVTPSEVAYLQSYALAVDTVQPRIYAYSRQFASLDEAVHGGISLDQKAMGATNLEATAQALAVSDTNVPVSHQIGPQKPGASSGEMAGADADGFIVEEKAHTSSSNIETVVENIRLGEKEVTAAFKRDMEQNAKVIREFLETKKGMQGVKITCSGDDCVAAVPSALDSRTKAELIKRFSATDNPAGRRISFVGNDIKSNVDRGMLTSHGESIEKKLRSELIGKLPKSTLDKLTFGIDMHGKAAGQGGVRLLIGNSQVRLRPGDFNLIDAAFKKSVDAINEAASVQIKRPSTYQVVP